MKQGFSEKVKQKDRSGNPSMSDPHQYWVAALQKMVYITADVKLVPERPTHPQSLLMV